jgi:hypothetical protein
MRQVGRREREIRERGTMEKNKERKVIAHFQSADTFRKLQRYRPLDRQILLEKALEELFRTKTADEIDELLEGNKLPHSTGRPKGVLNKSRNADGEQTRNANGESERTFSHSTDIGTISRVKGVAVRAPIRPEEPASKENTDDLGLSSLE